MIRRALVLDQRAVGIVRCRAEQVEQAVRSALSESEPEADRSDDLEEELLGRLAEMEASVRDEARADYFDSIFHSCAVVGLNTSAMVEAAVEKSLRTREPFQFDHRVVRADGKPYLYVLEVVDHAAYSVWFPGRKKQ